MPICLQQKVRCKLASRQAGKPQAKSPLVYVGIIDDDKNESCVCHVCVRVCLPFHAFLSVGDAAAKAIAINLRAAYQVQPSC